MTFWDELLNGAQKRQILSILEAALGVPDALTEIKILVFIEVRCATDFLAFIDATCSLTSSRWLRWFWWQTALNLFSVTPPYSSLAMQVELHPPYTSVMISPRIFSPRTQESSTPSTFRIRATL
jgi:hypothetical protein